MKKIKTYFLIDFGNHAIKSCYIAGVKKSYMEFESFQTLLKKIEVASKSLEITRILISSVWTNEENSLIKNSLLNFSKEVFFVDTFFDKIIHSRYKSLSLGMDRKAAILYSFFKNISTSVIIDAGTAITVDFVHKNIFEGGIITGGLNLELSALHENTKLLPLLQPDMKKISFPPLNTKDAILKGVVAVKGYGLKALVENEIIKNKIFKNKKYQILLSGGDAKYLNSYIKPSYMIENIVLKALNELNIKFNCYCGN